MGDNGGLIYKAIPAIMAEIDAIGKNRKNEQQGYKFRGIDDVYNEAHPLFVKHKVFTVPKVLEEKYDTVVTAKGTNLFYSRLKIQYLFYAEDGSSVEAVVIGEGMDSGDKASNKAMAVGHKYAIIQILAIPTEEPKDPENDSHETVARKLPVEMVEDAMNPETKETDVGPAPGQYAAHRSKAKKLEAEGKTDEAAAERDKAKAVLFETFGPALDYRIAKRDDGTWTTIKIEVVQPGAGVDDGKVPF